MTIKELTDIYAEEFYAIELLSNIDYKTLGPFKCNLDEDSFEALAFKTYFNEDKQISIIQIVIDEKKYIELKSFITNENL